VEVGFRGLGVGMSTCGYLELVDTLLRRRVEMDSVGWEGGSVGYVMEVKGVFC